MKNLGGLKMNLDNEVNNDIKFLAKSEIRLKILSELDKEPNNVRGIVKNTKITYSSVSSNIGKLQEKNYITKENKKYYPNPMTRIYFKSIIDFKNSVDLINNFDTFWNKHNLNQLSIDSIKRITDLEESKLVETTPVDIYKTHNVIKDQIIDSKNIKAIFPYLHPDYPNLIEEVLRNNGNVELIVPQSIFKELMHRIDEQVRKSATKRGKLNVYIFKNELNLYLTVCDKTMSLGLFKNDGSFDQNRILISRAEKSLDWADELFEHVKGQVKK
jgi:predicted transcriptional regulator